MKNIISIFLLLSMSTLANAEFQQDSILVSSENKLYEYTPSGMLLTQIVIPINTANEIARDITILDDGRLAVFNGTFSPVLSIYNGASWSNISIDGWSTPNNGAYGGITSVGSMVLVTDGYTGSGGEAQGLVVTDLTDQTSQRFINTSDYIDVTLGIDGLLYALKSIYGALDIIDPNTYTLIRSVSLGHSSGSRGVTANADGMIYMVSWDGYIGHYDVNGVLLNTISIGGNLQDIDIDINGRIIVGSRFGQVYLTDETFSSISEMQVTTSNTFVSFVSPIVNPEPPTLTGTHRKRGRNIKTILNWSTDATGVDIYFNDQLIDSVTGESTATYFYFKKLSQAFMVCNAGTEDCSSQYISK